MNACTQIPDTPVDDDDESLPPAQEEAARLRTEIRRGDEEAAQLRTGLAKRQVAIEAGKEPEMDELAAVVAERRISDIAARRGPLGQQHAQALARVRAADIARLERQRDKLETARMVAVDSFVEAFRQLLPQIKQIQVAEEACRAYQSALDHGGELADDERSALLRPRPLRSQLPAYNEWAYRVARANPATPEQQEQVRREDLALLLCSALVGGQALKPRHQMNQDEHKAADLRGGLDALLTLITPDVAPKVADRRGDRSPPEEIIAARERQEAAAAALYRPQRSVAVAEREGEQA